MHSRSISSPIERSLDHANEQPSIETIAKNLIHLITKGYLPLNAQPSSIFKAWMLLQFNSAHVSSVVTTIGTDGFPHELCHFARLELRKYLKEQTEILNTSSDGSSRADIEPEKRYLINHAMAAYAYFRPEEEATHLLPRFNESGSLELIEHSLTTVAQGPSSIEDPGLTYCFIPQHPRSDCHNCGPLVLFRGTPPSSSTGRFMARLDNFSPLGVGALQWKYIQKPLTKILEKSSGRIDVVGHSQGGSLALRLGAYAEKNLKLQTRAMAIDADSPAGDESFREITNDNHIFCIYVQKNDLVPMRSGALPKNACVLYGISPSTAAQAHLHLGEVFETQSGLKFNEIAKHSRLRDTINKISGCILFTFYAIAIVGKTAITLSNRYVCHLNGKKQGLLTRIELCCARALLITARIFGSLLIGIFQGIPFSFQWMAILISKQIPLKALTS